MNSTETIFFNIFCSLISSLIFLFLVLIFFKPKLKISPFICKSILEFENDEVHVIKLVNKSWFSAYDIKVELHLLHKYPTPPSGMMNKRYTPLNLKLNNISHIPAYRPFILRKEADHAIRIRTGENLSALLEEPNNLIELKVSLRHGLTGLSKVYKQEYADVCEVRKGKFSYGTKFDVI